MTARERRSAVTAGVSLVLFLFPLDGIPIGCRRSGFWLQAVERLLRRARRHHLGSVLGLHPLLLRRHRLPGSGVAHPPAGYAGGSRDPVPRDLISRPALFPLSVDVLTNDLVHLCVREVSAPRWHDLRLRQDCSFPPHVRVRGGRFERPRANQIAREPPQSLEPSDELRRVARRPRPEAMALLSP